jgi:hypothetical protein
LPSFAARRDLPSVGTSARGIAIAEFNGDGYPDIATSWASNQIAVYPGKGDGSFGAPIVTNVETPNSSCLDNIVTGDFNEDGHTDIVAATISGLQSDLVFLGKGDGTFQTPTAIPDSSGFFQARVVDINGDRHQDLITSHGANVVYLGNGDGTFTARALPKQLYSTSTFTGLAIGDFNGDKKIDFVMTDFDYGAGSLHFYAGNGDGTFQPPVPSYFLSYGPIDLCTADFDGDGKLDLLVGLLDQHEMTFLGDGNGTFRWWGGFNPYTSPSSPFADHTAGFSVATVISILTAVPISSQQTTRPARFLFC